MCVDLDNPTVRFFARDVGGNGKSPNLKVDVLYEDFDGHVKHLTVAKLHLDGEWQPSAIVPPMYMNFLALASPDGVTAVAFSTSRRRVCKRTRRCRSRVSTLTRSAADRWHRANT